MSLRPPPDPVEPLRETVPAGTTLYRVHEPYLPDGTVNQGTVPNPGVGKPSRFAFFGDPTVPALYLADEPEGAVYESVLHDAEPGSFLPRVQWQSKVLTVLEVVRDVDVVSFHSDGLRRFNLFASDLTDTDRTHYPESVQSAQAAWAIGAQGVSYMSRHYNSSKALCLFGDRLPEDTFRVHLRHPHARAFSIPQDREWLASLAQAMRVVLRP